MPGGFFLEHRWDRRSGDDRHIGLGTIAVEHDGAITGRFFDNLGYARTYALRERHDVWSFTGRSERATVTFSRDRATMTIAWERSKDNGATWQPLCNLTSTKQPAKAAKP